MEWQDFTRSRNSRDCTGLPVTGSCTTSTLVILPSVSNQDSIRSVDPESGSGSRRAKMSHKNRIFKKNFMLEVLDVLF
jgi:hypothetical protein